MESRNPSGRPHRPGNKALYGLLIIFGTIRMVVGPNWSDCPLTCQCKWISGKKTANCASAGFTAIPGLNAEIQVLDLKYNLITRLPKGAFSSAGLMNLQKIYLKNTTLREVHRDAFDDLKILVEIDLSDNLLTFIPRGTFSDNERLKILTLSGNPLQILSDEQFPPLPHLRALELENCQLHTIRTEAFVHLQSLENLNLNRNRMSAVAKEVFLPIVKLKSLSLDGNPWKCDCHLRDFRNWYLASNLNSISLSCAEPEHLKHKIWENIIDLDFGCAPRALITDEYTINKQTGDNVTLHCFVTGDPEPKTVWMFNGQEIYKYNDSYFLDKYVIETKKISARERWSNLTVLDLNEYDSGEFVCKARSYVGVASTNVSVILAQVVSANNIKRRHNYWFLFTGLVVGGLLIVVLISSVVACGCMSYNRKKRRKQRIRKSKAKAKGYYDQEKHLLDMSSSEQFSRKSSCERLAGSQELLKHSSSVSIDKCNPVRYINRRQLKETTIVPMMSTTALGMYPPPPPEFSGIPQSNTLGNIFISVSLSPGDPQVTVDRYPDLLDSHSRTIGRPKLKTSKSESVLPFATLPRRQLGNDEAGQGSSGVNSKYDNMGKRVTVGGSSTLSLHHQEHRRDDTIPTPPPPPLSVKPDFDYIPL